MQYGCSTVSPSYFGDFDTVKEKIFLGEVVSAVDIQKCVWGYCFHGAKISYQFEDRGFGLEGTLRTLQLLLEHFKSNEKSSELSQALLDAAAWGYVEILAILLSYTQFIDLNGLGTIDSNNYTALGYAAQRLCIRTVQSLLNARAEVDFEHPALRRSPLLIACRTLTFAESSDKSVSLESQKIEVIESLLSFGADISALDFAKKSAYSYLSKCGHTKAMKFLEHYFTQTVGLVHETLDCFLNANTMSIVVSYLNYLID